jgi:hypothetical protein
LSGRDPALVKMRERGVTFRRLAMPALISEALAIRTGVTYHEYMAKRLPPEVRAYFVKMGKKGGKLGGTIRAANLTPEQRSESARKAVRARWARIKGE